MTVLLPPWLGALIGVGLATITALLPPILLRIRGAAPFFAAAFISGSAVVVFLFIALSLPGQLKQAAFFPAHAAMAAVLIVIWVRRGRPGPGFSLRAIELRRWPAEARAHPVTAVAVGLASTALVVQLYMALRVTPNNWDSMTYHLARIGYWLTHETALPLESMSMRQAASAPNGEFLQGWTMLITGTDRLANSVQWLSLLGIAAVVFSAGRLLGHSRRASVTAGALFVLLPQPLLQATTTQNDLIVSFFIVATAFFLLRGLRDRAIEDLVVAGGAFGLAWGTKGSTGLAMPGLLLLVVAGHVHYRPSRQAVGVALAACVGGFLLFGSFSYVRNVIEDGTITAGLADQQRRHTDIPTNFVRNAWTFVDAPGVRLPWADTALPQLAHSTVGRLETDRFQFTVDSSVNEDKSAFGLLGLLLIAMAAAIAVRPGSATPRRLLAIAALSYFVLFAITVESTPFKGRTLMPVIAIAAPLLAGLRAGGRGFALALATMSAIPVLLVNQAKPLVTPEGEPNILGLDRVSQQTIMKPPLPGDHVQPAIRGYLAGFPGPRRFGFVGHEDSWVYPFFTRRFAHVLTPMRPEDVNLARLEQMNLEGVIFANLPPPADLQWEVLAPGYYFVMAEQ